jgi:hypothetical protein
MAVLLPRSLPTGSGKGLPKEKRAKDERKPWDVMGMPGAGLTDTTRGKASSDKPALKPYWGKPAVRNFRGDHGNVGIIRSPVRAMVLPDGNLLVRIWRGPRSATAGATLPSELHLIMEGCTQMFTHVVLKIGEFY